MNMFFWPSIICYKRISRIHILPKFPNIGLLLNYYGNYYFSWILINKFNKNVDMLIEKSLSIHVFLSNFCVLKFYVEIIFDYGCTTSAVFIIWSVCAFICLGSTTIIIQCEKPQENIVNNPYDYHLTLVVW